MTEIKCMISSWNNKLLLIYVCYVHADEWLDLGSSLNGQGIQQGDTVLLRKKFFILNDDIQEALEGNQILMDLLYQQVWSKKSK